MSENEQLEYWNLFQNTGKISDYLKFVSVSRGLDSADDNILSAAESLSDQEQS